jgi:hypothetical protein
MQIDARALAKGMQYYQFAIDKFMGNSVISRIGKAEVKTNKELQRILSPTISSGEGDWVDIGGLISPKSEILRLCNDIISGEVNDVEYINTRLREIHLHYYDMEWTWVARNMKSWWGKDCEELTIEDVVSIVEQWRKSVITIDQMLYDDARKEFSMVSKVGFGIDGTSQCKDVDFEQVRGDFEQDTFVKMVLDHMEEKNKLGDDILHRLGVVDDKSK